MELTLRTLHPNYRDEFFAYVKRPTLEQVELSIRGPNFHHGQGMLGDVAMFRYGEQPASLRFYLGLPGRALIVFQPFLEGEIKEYVRVCGERSDVFVVVPDLATDEYYNIPHKMFVPLEDAIDSAKLFLASQGDSFAPVNQTEEFTNNWIAWYDDDCSDPFTSAIQKHINDQNESDLITGGD